uniref:Uncharacterized protein n=1 Tax=Romanomermis culicivorax TaxID=13658 RepID=A0A915JK82_ROMCU
MLCAFRILECISGSRKPQRMKMPKAHRNRVQKLIHYRAIHRLLRLNFVSIYRN